MSHHKYVIIGSGPTGLGAAYRLKELGETDFVILEKQDYVGGLATSYTDDNGFTWDIGGHVQFSHYAYFDKLMMEALGEEGWLTHERESWVWMKDRFIPYPFQNNIRHLPKESMWKCLNGIIELYKKGGKEPPKNFGEWIYATFGSGIAEEFLMPYNYKVWAYPPEDMSYSWIGERVAVTDLQRVTKNILFEQDDVSWGPNNKFQFPKHGGTGAIWKNIGENLIGLEHVRLNTGVSSINPKTKTITTNNGETYTYDHLMSTMPIDKLCLMVEGIDQDIADTAQGLLHSSTNVIGIGLKGAPKPDLATKCWMYFPEDHSPYYRITVFSNYSPNNVPDINTQWSLMTETSESPKKPVDREKLVEETIDALLKDGLIESREQIISKFDIAFDYGYPTPSVGRDEILNKVQPYLESIGIFSRGRFGAWKYEVSNQDHSLMQGVEWANRVVLDVPETTINFPGTANAMWGKAI